MRLLGHILTADGICANPDKISAVVNMKLLRNVKHLLSFIQTCLWFRGFITNFAEVVRSLTTLTRKNVCWTWDAEQQSSFETLKKILVSAPLLRQADEKLPFIIRTVASDYALGAILLQGEGADERPVEDASRLLTSAEKHHRKRSTSCKMGS